MQHQEIRSRTIFFVTEVEEASTALYILPKPDFSVEILAGLNSTDADESQTFSIHGELPSRGEIRFASVEADRRKNLLFVERIPRVSTDTRR